MATTIIPHFHLPPSFTSLSVGLLTHITLLLVQSHIVKTHLDTNLTNIETPLESTIDYNSLSNKTPTLSNSTEDLIFAYTFPGPDSKFSGPVAVLLILIFLSIIIGTLMGNILVCVTVCLVRKLRRPSNYLIVSLAVSDLCVAILVMPMATFYEIFGAWPFGAVMCNFWIFFDQLSCTASILNLCMISVDRYYAITKPLEYGVKRTPRRMLFCVFLVWLIAFCITLPPLLIFGNEFEGKLCIVCQNFGYQIYATMGSFYIPFVVMVVVYYKIFRAARKIVNDEKRAQSHLETHCYLEINVKNGGTAEAKLLDTKSGADRKTANAGITRGSSASTNTTCSVEKSGSSIGRCFSNSQRNSNESQYPMLQTPKAPSRGVLTINQSANSQNQDHQKKSSESKPKLTKNNNRRKSSNASHTLSTATSRIRSSLSYFGKSQSRDGITSNSPHQKKLRFQLAKERKASTTLGIIMSVFIFCWFPFFVLALVRPFLHSKHAIPDQLSSFFLWLGYVNSTLNPIIYATLNKDFRKPFKEILYFRCSSLNHMMREEFYHTQYGDPDQHYCAVNSSSKVHNYEEGLEIVTAEEREDTRASESFL